MVFCAQWNSWVAWRHWLDEAMLRYQPGHIVALYVSCYSKNYSLLWPGAKSMERIRDKDTRYFLEIDIKTLKIVDHRFEQKAYPQYLGSKDHKPSYFDKDLIDHNP